MALRTQRPGVKLSTQIKGIITDALRSHFAETSHTPQFREVWTYEVPLIDSDTKTIVEIHGETRFSRSWADYRGPLGVWTCELRYGAVRGTPRQVDF